MDLEECIKNNIFHKYIDQDSLKAILIFSPFHKVEPNELAKDTEIILITDNHFHQNNRYALSGVTIPFNDDSYFLRYSTLEKLHTIKKNGTEPERFEFLNSVIFLSKVSNLVPLLREITTYPEKKQAQKTQIIYAYFRAWYFFWLNQKKNDFYLQQMVIHHLIQCGCQLLITHNKRFIPPHRWIQETLSSLSVKPIGFDALFQQMCQNPNNNDIDSFYHSINDFHNWPAIHHNNQIDDVLESTLNSTLLNNHTLPLKNKDNLNNKNQY